MIDEKKPWAMFAVDGLVKTVLTCALAIATTILVVVDLPAEPVMTTSPSGNFESVLANSPGAILLTTSPGRAEPPPGRTIRTNVRTKRPIRIAGM